MPQSRPPLERMLRIHQAIQAGKFPNASTLARELEVSAKSVHRDLEFMRDRLDLPLEYDGHRLGYFYTEEVNAFPTVQITEGELFALIVAEKALQQYRGTNFEKPLLSAIRKMEQSLPETISLNLADIEHTISFRTRAEPILNLDIFDALAKATAHRQQLELTYRKPARVQAVRQTGTTFARPEKFSLEKRLRDSFGVYSGGGEYEVILRFNARVADYVREKKWHASQRLRDLKGGGVELRMKLSSLVEIERWVLSWGSDAVVVKPRELAAAVKEAAGKILRSKLSE